MIIPDPATAAARAALLDQIEHLNRQEFPSSVLTAGSRAFGRRYFATYARHPSHALLVHVHEGAVVGFLAGRTGPKLMRVDRAALAVRATPRLAWRCATGLLRRRTATALITDQTAGRVAHLDIVAVDKGHRGHGTGTRLCEQFAAWARQQACDAVRLATPAGDDRLTTRFYAAQGFLKVGEAQAIDGTPQTILQKRV